MTQSLRATVFVLASAALAVAARQPGRLEVTAIRYWSLDSTTRVAIEVTGDCEYRSEKIQGPDRIFFDLIGARPSIEGHRVHTAEVGDKLLKRIRVAETQPGITRVVLDLEGATNFSVSRLSNPNRMIIELRPASLVVPPATPATPSYPIAPASPPAISLPPALRPVTPKSELARMMTNFKTLPPPPSYAQAAASSSTAQAGVATAPVLAAVQPATSSPAQAAAAQVPPAPGISPKAARRMAQGNSSLTRALGLKINRVVLDPGHGGHDQGTLGHRGLMEKELVLDVTLRLGKLIEERMGSEVVYTRSDDTYVPLRTRTELANQKKADLFLSVHANSSPYPRIGGVETYYLNLTRSAESLDLAARENASSDKSVFELRDLIQSITLQDKVEESKEFAGRVQTALQSFENRYSSSGATKNRGIKKAPFVVLIGASMPSILAEIGFLSNSREEAMLKKPEHRQKLAEALYQGVSQYATTLSHFQVATRAGE